MSAPVSRRNLLAWLAWATALGLYGALLWASAPACPDDWDGIGFVASITDFDLARFHPHPPGYPVYVALLRLAAVVVRDSWRACLLVAVASGVVTTALVSDATRRRCGARTAVVTGILVAVTPLSWRAASGVGSEAPALALLAAAGWGLSESRGRKRLGPAVLGCAVGLGLGVRLSWAPVYLGVLALAPPGARTKAWGSAVASCLVWALPLLAIVGPGRLLALYAVHFAGHAQRWGGTVVTEPGWRRVAWLARDVFDDGLGVELDVVGALIGVLVVATVVQAVLVWRRAAWAGWRSALVVVLPYLAWIAVGQNLRDQPRHVLPLVAVLMTGLGWSTHRDRWVWVLAGALGLALSLRTGLDARGRRTIPPAGQQLLALARTQPAPRRLAIFGVASIRFFEGTELADRAFPAASLGDVQVNLTHMDRLPARIWVTDEVDTSAPSRWPLRPVVTLCRPARLDRRAPCLAVREWRPPFLPSD